MSQTTNMSVNPPSNMMPPEAYSRSQDTPVGSKYIMWRASQFPSPATVMQQKTENVCVWQNPELRQISVKPCENSIKLLIKADAQELGKWPIESWFELRVLFMYFEVAFIERISCNTKTHIHMLLSLDFKKAFMKPAMKMASFTTLCNTVTL